MINAREGGSLPRIAECTGSAKPDWALGCIPLAKRNSSGREEIIYG
jgi:hypothetical protein